MYCIPCIPETWLGSATGSSSWKGSEYWDLGGGHSLPELSIISYSMQILGVGNMEHNYLEFFFFSWERLGKRGMSQIRLSLEEILRQENGAHGLVGRWSQEAWWGSKKVRQKANHRWTDGRITAGDNWALIPQGPSDTQSSINTCLSVFSLSRKEAGIFIHQFLSFMAEVALGGIYSFPLRVCHLQKPSTILWPEKALRQRDTQA